MDFLAPLLWLTTGESRYAQVLIIAKAWKQKQAGRFLKNLPRGQSWFCWFHLYVVLNMLYASFAKQRLSFTFILQPLRHILWIRSHIPPMNTEVNRCFSVAVVETCLSSTYTSPPIITYSPHRSKSLLEVRKLRAQLTNTVNFVRPECQVCMDPKMAPPTDHQVNSFLPTS